MKRETVSFSFCLTLLPTLALSSIHNPPISSPPPTAFNLTTLSARNGVSVLECWQLSSPFEISNRPGIEGALSVSLGNLSAARYNIIPPKFDGGRHVAPAVQYVFVTSGLAHITVPNSSNDVWVRGGKYGLIIAADTADVSETGHNTTFPSSRETGSLTIPTEGGKIPAHQVLHDGACERYEMEY